MDTQADLSLGRVDIPSYIIHCTPAQHHGYIFTDDIVAKIRESGFKIAMKKEVQLNKEQAEEFYSEHKDQDYFDELTNRMSS